MHTTSAQSGTRNLLTIGLECLLNASFCSGRSHEMRAQRATETTPACSKNRYAAQDVPLSSQRLCNEATEATDAVLLSARCNGGDSPSGFGGPREIVFTR